MPKKIKKVASEPKIVEDKRQKFIRLATFRVNKAIKAIYGVAKLSARASYLYEDADILHIESALNEAVEATILRFKGHKHLAEAFQIKSEEVKII